MSKATDDSVTGKSRHYDRADAHVNAKLTAEAVREIRASAEPTALLAKRFGVSQAAVNLARKGITWRSVLPR